MMRLGKKTAQHILMVVIKGNNENGIVGNRVIGSSTSWWLKHSTRTEAQHTFCVHAVLLSKECATCPSGGPSVEVEE